MGVIIDHENTPQIIMTKMASSRDSFVATCDKIGVDPDVLMDSHRRRRTLETRASARAILRKLGASASKNDIEILTANAATLEKVAFLGSLRGALGMLATWGLGNLLKIGTGIGLVAGIIYLLGKGGFLGKPKKLTPEQIELAKKSGVPNAAKIMPYSDAILNDPKTADAVKRLEAYMCKKHGKCNQKGSWDRIQNVVRNADGTINKTKLVGVGLGTAPLAAGALAGGAHVLKNLLGKGD